MDRRVILRIATLTGILLPSVALAATPQGAGTTLTLAKVVQLVTAVINTFLALSVTAAIAMVIYGGMKMATSHGDVAKFKEGRQTLINACIGLVVILGVGIIIATIGSFAVNPTQVLR